MALLVALISVGTIFVNALSRAVEVHEDRVTVEFMGTDPASGTVELFFSNLGDRTAAIQRASLVLPRNLVTRMGAPSWNLSLPPSCALRPEDAGPIRFGGNGRRVPRVLGEFDNGDEFSVVVVIRRFNGTTDTRTFKFIGLIE